MSNSLMYDRLEFPTPADGKVLEQKPKPRVHKLKSSASKDDELPGELDFFKYAQGGSTKRKADQPDGEPKEKKRKRDEESDDESEEEDREIRIAPQRHRVVAKGSNVPEHVDTFEELSERYKLSSLLLSNLSKYGYTHPTAIQSYGTPILLEVNASCNCDETSSLTTRSVVPGSRCDLSHRNRENPFLSPSYFFCIGRSFVQLKN